MWSFLKIEHPGEQESHSTFYLNIINTRTLLPWNTDLNALSASFSTKIGTIIRAKPKVSKSGLSRANSSYKTFSAICFLSIVTLCYSPVNKSDFTLCQSKWNFKKSIALIHRGNIIVMSYICHICLFICHICTFKLYACLDYSLHVSLY